MFVETKPEGEVQTPVLAPWRQLLLDAVNIMEERGQCRGALTDKYGQVCALGAMYVADKSDPPRFITQTGWDAAFYFEQFLNKPIGEFNDKNLQSTVVAAMRCCATTYGL